jgi:hypothetical protein
MTFVGDETLRAKIIVDGKIMEQVSTFIYLGCEICGAGEHSYHFLCGTVMRTLGSGPHPASYTMGTMGSFPRVKGRCVKLTTHLRLESRLKMHSPIPPYVFTDNFTFTLAL